MPQVPGYEDEQRTCTLEAASQWYEGIMTNECEEEVPYLILSGRAGQ